MVLRDILNTHFTLVGVRECVHFTWIMSRSDHLKSNLLSLGRYLCWWTISPQGYHPSSSQCFDTDMFY